MKEQTFKFDHMTVKTKDYTQWKAVAAPASESEKPKKTAKSKPTAKK